MKRLLFLILLLSMAMVTIGQQKPPVNRSTENRVQADYALWPHYFLGLPHGSTPSFPSYVPDSLKDGAMYRDTIAHITYFYNALTHTWEPSGGSGGITMGPASPTNYAVFMNASGQLVRVPGLVTDSATYLAINKDFYLNHLTTNSRGNGNVTSLPGGKLGLDATVYTPESKLFSLGSTPNIIGDTLNGTAQVVADPFDHQARLSATDNSTYYSEIQAASYNTHISFDDISTGEKSIYLPPGIAPIGIVNPTQQGIAYQSPQNYSLLNNYIPSAFQSDSATRALLTDSLSLFDVAALTRDNDFRGNDTFELPVTFNSGIEMGSNFLAQNNWGMQNFSIYTTNTGTDAHDVLFDFFGGSTGYFLRFKHNDPHLYYGPGGLLGGLEKKLLMQGDAAIDTTHITAGFIPYSTGTTLTGSNAFYRDPATGFIYVNSAAHSVTGSFNVGNGSLVQGGSGYNTVNAGEDVTSTSGTFQYNVFNSVGKITLSQDDSNRGRSSRFTIIGDPNGHSWTGVGTGLAGSEGVVRLQGTHGGSLLVGSGFYGRVLIDSTGLSIGTGNAYYAPAPQSVLGSTITNGIGYNVSDQNTGPGNAYITNTFNIVSGGNSNTNGGQGPSDGATGNWNLYGYSALPNYLNGYTGFGLGVSTTNIKARVHIAAGSSTIPAMIINAGPALTTEIDGHFNYDGTNYTGAVGTIKNTFATDLNTLTLQNKTIDASHNALSNIGPSNMTAAAFSFNANNTSSTAAPVATVFKQVPQQTYAGTITWDGTAPTTLTNETYSWSQVGNLVTIAISIKYTTGGTTNTTATLTLPTDCPIPKQPGGFTAANNYLYYGSGGLTSSPATIVGNNNKAAIANDAAGTGYVIIISGASTSAKIATAVITYLTN